MGIKRGLLVAFLVGCGPGPLKATAPVEVTAPVSFAELPPQLAAGEQMAWNVYLRGLELGRATLVVGPHAAQSRFKTGVLASALANVRYELTTALDRGVARASTEALTRKGATERSEAAIDGARYRLDRGEPVVAPGGGRVHTLHTALGVVRAWSRLDERRGSFLWLLHGGELYRLDVVPPRREDVLDVKALRVDGLVRSFDRDTSIDVSVWLAANDDRTPVQIVVRASGEQISAELVESTASFETR